MRACRLAEQPPRVACPLHAYTLFPCSSQHDRSSRHRHDAKVSQFGAVGEGSCRKADDDLVKRFLKRWSAELGQRDEAAHNHDVSNPGD